MSSAILAKFVSLHDNTCKDFTMTQDDVVIGRKKGCTHCIPNTKIRYVDLKNYSFLCILINSDSGEHCRVTLDREDGIFTITDYSTNGTFVNDKKIKKNEPTIISNEDRIYLLKDQEEGMKIGFIFVSVFKQKQLKNERKRMREEVEEEKEDDEDSSNKRFKVDEESIADQVKCSLCLEVMYKPVSLQPCTHNFCGGCFSGWIKTHNDCPECKGKIKHIKQNRMLISMIVKYLENNSKEEKTKEVKKAQDEKDIFLKDIISLENARKAIKDLKIKSNNNKEENKKEDVKMKFDAKEDKCDKCDKCDKRIKDFQCSKDTKHAKCNACNEGFPITNMPGINVQCIKCQKYFCHQQSKCKNFMKNKLGTLCMLPFAGITQNSLNKNSFEQKVIKDYISKKKFTIIQFKDDIVNKCDKAKDWDIEDKQGNNQILSKDSAICMECAPKIWDILIYKYREAISNDLPQNVKTRSNCWYGYGCRTQAHNFSHASKLNHICKSQK